MLGSQSRQAQIQRRQAEVVADHGEQDPDTHRREDDESDRDRERDAGLGLRVEMVSQVARQTWVALDLLDDRLTGQAGSLDLRPAPSDQAHDSRDRHTCADRQYQDHGEVYPRRALG